MKKQGKGVAAMFYPIGTTAYANPASAFIKVNQDGTAVLYTGTTEIGPGTGDGHGPDRRRGTRDSSSIKLRWFPPTAN